MNSSGGVGFYSLFMHYGLSWKNIVEKDLAQHWHKGEIFWFQTITHVVIPQRPGKEFAIFFEFPLLQAILAQS